MSYGGSVLDMINKIKYNQSIKDNRKARYSRVKEVIMKNELHQSFSGMNKSEIPADTLNRIKQQIRKKAQDDYRRYIVIQTIIWLIIALGIGWLFTKVVK